MTRHKRNLIVFVMFVLVVVTPNQSFELKVKRIEPLQPGTFICNALQLPECLLV